MLIPNGPRGVPTVSPSMLRAYGVGGFHLSGAEAPRGCPRQYRALYVDRVVDRHDTPSDAIALRFGRIVHTVLELMEQGTDPDTAIADAWEPDLDADLFGELRALILNYLARGASPVDQFHTLDTERRLVARLYEDEDYGPVDLQGVVDWVGIDPEDARTVRVVDYKSNRRVPSRQDVAGDVQLKAYHWLVEQCADELGLPPNPFVIVHLDAVRWRDVETRFTPEAIEHWHAWVVAVVRAILRDTTARPQVNPGCPDCPVKGTCPAWRDLPAAAVSLVKRLDEISDPAARLRWRDAANAARLALEKGVDRIDAGFKAQALEQGPHDVGGARFSPEPRWGDEIDLPALHRATGDEFYGLVRTSRAAIERGTADWDPSDRATALAAVHRVPIDTTVRRTRTPSSPPEGPTP